MLASGVNCGCMAGNGTVGLTPNCDTPGSSSFPQHSYTTLYFPHLFFSARV